MNPTTLAYFAGAAVFGAIIGVGTDRLLFEQSIPSHTVTHNDGSQTTYTYDRTANAWREQDRTEATAPGADDAPESGRGRATGSRGGRGAAAHV